MMLRSGRFLLGADDLASSDSALIVIGESADFEIVARWHNLLRVHHLVRSEVTEKSTDELLQRRDRARKGDSYWVRYRVVKKAARIYEFAGPNGQLRLIAYEGIQAAQSRRH